MPATLTAPATTATPRVKDEIDWSFDTTFAILTAEFCKLADEGKIRPGLAPNRQWLADIFDSQSRRFGNTLGPTLRKVIPVAAATGLDLMAVFREQWGNQEYYVPFPTELKHTHLDSGEWTEYKRDKSGRPVIGADGNYVIVKKKITRWLADYVKKQLTTDDPQKLEQEKEFPAAFISQIMDSVNRANGAYMVLSGHPLDILYSSDYSTFTSCHQWATIAGKDTQPHSSANFCYLSGPAQTLIAYMFKPTRPRFPAEGKWAIPEKHFRQYIFCPSERPYLAWFGRTYPGGIGEPQHMALRRLVAETLTGEPSNDDGSQPKWRYVTAGSIQWGTWNAYTKFGSAYAYSDSHTAYLDASPDRDKNPTLAQLCTSHDSYARKYYSHEVPAARCPCCLVTRDDAQYSRILCDDCVGRMMKCSHDGKSYQVTDETIKEWLYLGGTKWVSPANRHHYARCEITNQVFQKKYGHEVVTGFDPLTSVWIHNDYIQQYGYFPGPKTGRLYRNRLRGHKDAV